MNQWIRIMRSKSSGIARHGVPRFRETIAANARRSSVKRIFSAVIGEAG